jgi:hypothetical protein
LHQLLFIAQRAVVVRHLELVFPVREVLLLVEM